MLALGMLTAIRRALDLISGATRAHLAMTDVPAEDPAVRDDRPRRHRRRVQIESRAQMAMLPRLAEDYYDLRSRLRSCGRGRSRAAWCTGYRRRQGLELVTIRRGGEGCAGTHKGGDLWSR